MVYIQTLISIEYGETGQRCFRLLGIHTCRLLLKNETVFSPIVLAYL